MEEFERDGWRIAFDAEATRRATARLERGAADACGCVGCIEYLERRDALLPHGLRDLLERLGCDPAKDWELTPLQRGPGPAREVLAAWRLRGRLLAAGEGPYAFTTCGDEELLLEVALDFDVPGERAGT